MLARDKIIPPKRARFFAQRLGVPLETIDAEHDAMLTEPRTLARMLAD